MSTPSLVNLERANQQYKDSIKSLTGLVERVVFNNEIHFSNEISNILRKLFKDTRSVKSIFSHLEIKDEIKIINRFLTLSQPPQNSKSIIDVDLIHVVSYFENVDVVTPELISNRDSIVYPIMVQRDKSACLPLQVGRCQSFITLRMTVDHGESEKESYLSALKKHNQPIYQDLSVEKWMNDKNFIKFNGLSFSRGDVFLEKCERDGGTHVDDLSKLSEMYTSLSLNEYPFIEMLICEIALEVLQSQSIFEFFINNRLRNYV